MATKSKPKQTWFVVKLKEMGACGEAIRYAKTKRTFPAAWRECDSRGWLEWLVERLGLVPEHDYLEKPSRCPRCKCEKQTTTLGGMRRRFPAEQVAKALRAVK